MSTSTYADVEGKEGDTTRFSGVEFQFQPTARRPQEFGDTTRFSGVEFQLQPTASDTFLIPIKRVVATLFPG